MKQIVRVGAGQGFWGDWLEAPRRQVEGGPIAYMAVESTAMGLEELSWYIDNTISKRLLAIPGMAAVSRGEAHPPAARGPAARRALGPGAAGRRHRVSRFRASASC